MSKIPQKMPNTSSYYHPLTDWLLWATISNHGHSVMGLPLVISSPQPTMDKTPQNQIPCYYPPTDWLLGQQLVTISTQ